MEGPKIQLHLIFPAVAVAALAAIGVVSGQVTPAPPCTSSMLTSFTPCMNYLTNSSGSGSGSGSGSSPTAQCCGSLKALMTNGTECLCQIVTGGVPFRFPVNRSLAISLPRACNQPGVPVQCKASPGAPVPAPASSVPTTTSPALAPASDTTPGLTPPSTAGSLLPPTSTTGGNTLTPSAAERSLPVSPSVLLFALGVMIMKYY